MNFMKLKKELMTISSKLKDMINTILELMEKMTLYTQMHLIFLKMDLTI